MFNFSFFSFPRISHNSWLTSLVVTNVRCVPPSSKHRNKRLLLHTSNACIAHRPPAAAGGREATLDIGVVVQLVFGAIVGGRQARG